VYPRRRPSSVAGFTTSRPFYDPSRAQSTHLRRAVELRPRDTPSVLASLTVSLASLSGGREGIGRAEENRDRVEYPGLLMRNHRIAECKMRVKRSTNCTHTRAELFPACRVEDERKGRKDKLSLRWPIDPAVP